MAATDRTVLLRKVRSDTVRFTLFGCSAGLGFMITHEPGSSEFVLRWDADKLVCALAGSAFLAVMVGLIRWRMLRRSHPEALDRVGDAVPVRSGSEAAVRTYAVELVDDVLHRVIAMMPLETGFSERRWQVDATQAKVEVVPVLPLRPAHKRVLAPPDELVVTPDKLRELTWSVILTSVRED
ncbi:hypothetical protein [Methylobacterium sp. R2-1]|uniref:hypothetical protein n=1 Tax=Methylobacterium sp. R2-1 TaxID=2587064 RepID=UPI00161B529A|nr:hypothetical protein [Methylobacterium sp. R2-1]MBB2961786.1 hypothetical protein [Methylobacterium sp. R2-1]